MHTLLEWLVQQRSGIAITLSLVLFAATLVLRYGFDLWWPAGIVLATVFGVVGLFAGNKS